MLLSKVISGGETGIDQCALEAAKRCDIETGGTIGNGFWTEKGFMPELGTKYGLVELADTNHMSNNQMHAVRSKKNVDDADGTLIMAMMRDGSVGGPGTKKTLGYCLTGEWKEGNDWMIKNTKTPHKPVLVIKIPDLFDAAIQLHAFVVKHNIQTLNVAGPRASKMWHPADEHIKMLVSMFEFVQNQTGPEPMRPPEEKLAEEIGEKLIFLNQQWNDASFDARFASRMIAEFTNVVKAVHNEVDKYPRYAARKQPEVNSYQSILDGLRFQEKRALDHTEYLIATLKSLTALEEQIDQKSEDELRQELDRLEKEDEVHTYLPAFEKNDTGPGKRKRNQ